MNRGFKTVVAVSVFCLWAAASHGAGSVAVAAAANLTHFLGPLDAAFLKKYPDVAIRAETGASGSLVTQIANGAPYDVFLSADTEYPRHLAEMGPAPRESVVTFAYGRLVLFTGRSEINLTTVEDVVRDSRVLRIAIANPKSAPYGRAAEEALGNLAILDLARPRFVYGENITQTAQFVASGNADVGFVAMSLVVAPAMAQTGRWIEVPSSLYTPIAQGAVLTAKGRTNPEARRYLEFLTGPEAQSLFRNFGYGLPN